MSLDERNELWEAFNLFDSGGDGLINASELHMVMQAIGRNMSEDEVRTEIKKIKKQQRSEQSGSDEDDEELNFDEFIELISEEMNDNMTKEELKEAFQEFCLDSNDKFGFNPLTVAHPLGENLEMGVDTLTRFFAHDVANTNPVIKFFRRNDGEHFDPASGP